MNTDEQKALAKEGLKHLESADLAQVDLAIAKLLGYTVRIFQGETMVAATLVNPWGENTDCTVFRRTSEEATDYLWNYAFDEDYMPYYTTDLNAAAKLPFPNNPHIPRSSIDFDDNGVGVELFGADDMYAYYMDMSEAKARVGAWLKFVEEYGLPS